MTDVGTLVADFLADAEAGGKYGRDELHDLRRELAHVVASDLGMRDAAAVGGQDVQALVDARRAAGVPADTVLQALRRLFAYAVDRGVIRSSPVVGLAPAAASAPSPTTAMVAFGARVATWTARAVVAGFVLAAIGLVVALA